MLKNSAPSSPTTNLTNTTNQPTHKVTYQKLYKMTTDQLENELMVLTEWVEKPLRECEEERVDALLEEISQRSSDFEEQRQADWLSVQM